MELLAIKSGIGVFEKERYDEIVREYAKDYTDNEFTAYVKDLFPGITYIHLANLLEDMKISNRVLDLYAVKSTLHNR